MGYDTTDLREAFAEAQRREDEKDFHDEMAGRDTYKIARFLSAEHREDRREHRSSQARRADGMSRLQTLLASNAAYAKTYNDTFDALRAAEAATERAIAKMEAARDQAQQDLAEMMGRAPRLADGRRVFKDQYGKFWDQNGGQVSADEGATIEWRGDEATQEEFAAQEKRYIDLYNGVNELRGYQVDTLGRARDRMTDQENPPKAEELEQFQRDIQERMPAAARAELTSSTPVVSIATPAKLDIPTL